MPTPFFFRHPKNRVLRVYIYIAFWRNLVWHWNGKRAQLVRLCILTSASHSSWHWLHTLLTWASQSSWHQPFIRFEFWNLAIGFAFVFVLPSALQWFWHRLRIHLDIGFVSFWHQLPFRLYISTSASHWFWHRLRIHLDIGFALSRHQLRIHFANGFVASWDQLPFRLDIGFALGLTLASHQQNRVKKTWNTIQKTNQHSFQTYPNRVQTVLITTSNKVYKLTWKK